MKTERDEEDVVRFQLTRESYEALRIVAFHKRISINKLLAGAVQEMLENVLGEGMAEAHARRDELTLTTLFETVHGPTANNQLVRAVHMKQHPLKDHGASETEGIMTKSEDRQAHDADQYRRYQARTLLNACEHYFKEHPEPQDKNSPEYAEWDRGYERAFTEALKKR